MLASKTNRFFIIFGIHLCIALGFYFGNLKANYSSLSGDLQNIIPVAQKFDNPELFKNDLYLDDINNVKYYTPFFVQSLRFVAKFTNADYVQALNVISAFCHLLFGILWFYLIYRFVPDFWIAVLVSFLIRGIVWLPGLEIWGIAELWSIMPRTVYIVFFPIPFLVLNKSWKGLLFSAFLIGLIFNFHPITGLGGILLYLVFLVLLVFIFKMKNRATARNILFLFCALALGMLPFIVTYFGKTSSTVTYDMSAFTEAFNARIPAFFTEPLLYLQDWLHFKTLFYAVPILVYLIISRDSKLHFKCAKTIIILTAILIFLPSISVYVEHFVNTVLGLNLRIAFQLIRAQKVAIIPSFFAMAYSLQYVNTKIKGNYFLPTLFSIYFIMLLVCKLPTFNAIPFAGDDIARSVLPNNLSFGSINPVKELSVDRMGQYILENTNQDAVIYGGHYYRGASKRSVILDSKGASMIIEGNPSQFIQWKKDQSRLSHAPSIEEKTAVLRSFGVNYIVSKKQFQLEVIHVEGNFKLYLLQ
ncbi:hypothetical protein [Lacinutrix jangbogonensis]|uniref:hypothetical protein n=1 Tax=Lacinutrix jangbogonensis TaxID=1469557 RepID=UPI00053E6D8A|nr:hypothetical protein [Lacinutrix jangbogonensis]